MTSKAIWINNPWWVLAYQSGAPIFEGFAPNHSSIFHFYDTPTPLAATLFGELVRGEYEAPRQVKFHMLMLWLPLFCYAGNGLAFPVLTGYERTEVERVMEELIFSLPAADQEVILNNWLQDFTISSSDWPNLQRCYDRWCQSSRSLLFWTTFLQMVLQYCWCREK